MGNRLSGQKSSKPKEDKKREKEEEKLKKKTTKKEKKESKSKKKEKAKKADSSKSKHSSGRDGDHQYSGSEFDTDLESSHVTGGDSESVVFHSAENISSSPYLDSHTRSELEHSGTWSALYESSAASRHPQVLSSRDFRDGFSLEACIPPEIARRDTSYYDHHDGGGSGGGGSGSNAFSYSNSGSLKSKRSNSTKSSRATPSTYRQHASDDLMSVSTTSSHMGREGYSTPLLNTPVFGRVDRSHSPSGPCGASSTLARVHEADRDSMDISPFDPNAKVYTTYNPPAHLAHLYQYPSQTIDYRNLPKPTSPHPQRRALSPKMTSPPFKLISSDDSSSTPSTPVPQRKTSHILADLLRPGRRSVEKKKHHKGANTSESDENGVSTPVRKTLAEEEEKKKSKGLSMWKTWERSSKKKKEKSGKTSIFGTSRKTSKKSDNSDTNDVRIEEDRPSKRGERMSDSTLKDLNVFSSSGATVTDKSSKSKETSKQRPPQTTKSSTSSYENSSSRGTSDVDYWGDKNRNSSPPVAKSAAFCIMRLEELERNIEKTIREKFPDAEPFLIRKRTPPDDSSRGSKSLPTTPSPKKKMLVVHDNTQSSQKEAVTSTLTAASNKLGTVVGATRYYDESFEESASPVMSPVVLRRFGARTRHASISPKIQRAKTAHLYNSPSEMARVSECVTPDDLESPPNESTNQRQAKSHSTTTKPSKSKSFQCHGHHLVRQRKVELSESDDDTPRNSYIQSKETDTQNIRGDQTENVKGKGGVDTDSFDKPVIVPSFSAVFGSVSPKLKRHLQSKFEGGNANKDTRSFDQSNYGAQPNVKNGASSGKTVSSGHRSESVDSALKNSRNEQRRRFILGEPITSEVDDWASRRQQQQQQQQQQQRQQQKQQQPPQFSKSQDSTSSPSVRSRADNIMKTISEGWAGGGEGSGGYPSSPPVHSSDQAQSTSTVASPTSGWTNSSSHLRSADTKHPGEAKVETKESHVTSPGSRRKHSTDHVIFGSAVALPCRHYPNTSSPPSSPERKKGTTTNNKYLESHFDSTPFAHAPSSAERVHERNVKRREGQVDVSANTPSTHSEHVETSSCKESRTLSDRGVDHTRGVIRNSGSSSSVDNKDGSKSGVLATKSRGGRDGRAIHQSAVVSGSILGGDFPYSLRKDVSSKDEAVQKVPTSGTQVEQSHEQFVEDEQQDLVLKQPVSKVISDMINSSKQRQQHQQQHQQQQQLEQQQWHQQQQQQQQQQQHKQQNQRNWQASPTTPDKDAIHVETAVTMVTTPSFEQGCLSLEEKRVFNGSSYSPSSSFATDSREDERENQSEKVSAHDELIIKRSGGKGMECAQANVTDSNGAAVSQGTSSETSEGSDLDRFMKSVQSSEKLSTRSKTMEAVPGQSSVDNVEQNPPPPRGSPTADAKVSEILEEEEEEEDVEDEEEALEAMNEGYEPRAVVNLALVRQTEMRAFSDEVCQRLSDLLSSHTGSDEVFVGTDWKGEEDDDNEKALEEEGEEEEEEEVFADNLNTMDKMPDYTDDLQADWENPGLLSELSQDPLAPSLSANELTPASELLRRHRFSTSSSLTTSTSSSSSSSGLFAPPSLPPTGKRNVEATPKRKNEQEYFTYRKQEDDNEYFNDDIRSRQEEHSRCYHSDDDVARGGGIPDYYDDRPLWKKRQKAPGQLSITLAATRRRERRERWLKKRRRNKTDLLSTGSSEMGSQTSLRRGSRLSFGDSTGSCDYDEDDEVAKALSSHRRAMGSGILCSPKYSKPIMPFLGSGDIQRASPAAAKEEVITAERVAPRLNAALPKSSHDDFAEAIHDSGDRDSSTLSRSSDRTLHDEHSQSLDTMDELDDRHASLTTPSTETTATMSTTSATGSHSHIAIPGLEETFDELMSVKQILEDLQDRAPATGGSSGVQNQRSESNSNKNSNKFMPLTAENIKSIREYYKDNTGSGNGRRSRLSNTDRTESDLDLFSEYRDDASTDSNLYADDEEDDDNNEPYATADDDVGGATGGDDVEDFVVSCTFYNSNSAPPDYVNVNKTDKPFEGNIGTRTFTSGGVSFKDSELPSMAFNNSSSNNNNNGNNNNNNNNTSYGGESFQDLLARPAGSVYGRSNSAPGTRSAAETQLSLARDASAAGYNSDEEFWAGRAAFERSYQQLESAAGAVSSTFQNAREQMMDIQQHLQALRRQMEGLQDDLTSTSYTLTPDFSAFDSK